MANLNSLSIIFSKFYLVRSLQYFILIISWFLLLNTSASGLPTIELRINKEVVRAEVANTPDSQQLGLMYRKELADSSGMLFIFNQKAGHCFWMKNTLIPLSIAFVDRDNVIVKIEDMQPETENEHCSGKPVVFAIEVNQGWFKNNNINVGDKIDSISHVE